MYIKNKMWDLPPDIKIAKFDPNGLNMLCEQAKNACRRITWTIMKWDVQGRKCQTSALAP